MKQTKLMVMATMAVALMATSCASKKDLQNCQNENKELSSNYQATKEKQRMNLWILLHRQDTDTGRCFRLDQLHTETAHISHILLLQEIHILWILRC